MKGSLDYNLFYIYMFIFVGSISVLSLSGNLLVLLVGWEGVGILSYLLINYWNLRVEANKSSLKALLLNKIGDFSIIFGCILIHNTIISVDNTLISRIIVKFKHEHVVVFGNTLIQIVGLVGLLLIIGAITKSAQFVFSVWLPDAMEGPTPVSSLIHSSTMVAAGYLLLLKYSVLFQVSLILSIIICFLGLFTNLLSTLLTLSTTDVKNTLANSTTGQIAYMFFILGLGFPIASLVQFISHAFYKSLLFMSFGGLIHQVNNNQEGRRLGWNYLQNPLTYTCLFIGLLNFISIPGYISHYSKVNILILVVVLKSSLLIAVKLITEYSQFINFIAGVSLFKTLINFNTNLSNKNSIFSNHSWEVANLLSLASLVILSICCVFLGFLIVTVFNSYVYLNQTLNFTLDFNDSFYNGYVMSLSIFTITILTTFISIFIFKVNSNLNYNQISSVNNFEVDKIIINFTIGLFNLSKINNFLYNNKLLHLATYIKTIYKLL